MRLHQGAPRQNYENVLRAIGALLDQRGMREITVLELDDGFVVQGLALVPGEDRPSTEPGARLAKETVQLLEDDVTAMVDEAAARRSERRAAGELRHANRDTAFYEPAMRAIGAYLDQQQPRDIFFLEQERQFVLRLLMSTRAGPRHVLVEFTREEIEAMVEAATPNHRP